MAAITRGEAAHLNFSTVVLRAGVIGLTLATAAIPPAPAAVGRVTSSTTSP